MEINYIKLLCVPYIRMHTTLTPPPPLLHRFPYYNSIRFTLRHQQRGHMAHEEVV